MAAKTAALHDAQLPAWEAWLVRHRRIFEVAGSLLVGLATMSVLWQLLYPADRALPNMRIGGLDIGGKDRSAIVGLLNDYAQNGHVTITSPSREWQAKWQTIGVNIDAEASADAALSYGQWERLIPFSATIRMQQLNETPLIALIDNDRLQSFAEKIVAEDKQAAKDATISVKDGEVIIDEAKNGYMFTVDEVKRQVQASTVSADASLRLIPEYIPFTRATTELGSLKNQAESILAHQLTIKVGNKDFKPEPRTVGSWLIFPEDPKTKQLQLAFNEDEMRNYLLHIDEQSKIAPGTSTVTLLDGQEISRTPAPSGKSVAVSDSIAHIKNALVAKDIEPVVTLTVTDVPPRLSYVRTYSQTNEGLLAIIKDWDAASYGDYAVIIRELGGSGRYAEYRPDKRYVTASTFKLFTYLAVQDKIKKGQINYNTKTDIGWRVEDCLHEMIVRSTNPCAISLMNLVGWEEAQRIVAEAGFPSTDINNRTGGDKHSTVRDEANYMLRLYHRTLMEPEATNRLLGYLKRQIWRAGIPSGVPRGTVVADKVGLYNGWVHDVAIVYGPKSHYILAIMSKNGSDPAFADLSRRVYNFFRN